MALATLACFDSSARSPRSQRSRSVTRGVYRALAELHPRLRRVAIDRSLDLEQGVDAFHRLEGDGGVVLRRLALADVGFHVGEFEELAPRVAPAWRRGHRAGLSAGGVKLVVAGMGHQLAGVPASPSGGRSDIPRHGRVRAGRPPPAARCRRRGDRRGHRSRAARSWSRHGPATAPWCHRHAAGQRRTHAPRSARSAVSATRPPRRQPGQPGWRG